MSKDLSQYDAMIIPLRENVVLSEYVKDPIYIHNETTRMSGPVNNKTELELLASISTPNTDKQYYLSLANIGNKVNESLEGVVSKNHHLREDIHKECTVQDCKMGTFHFSLQVKDKMVKEGTGIRTFDEKDRPNTLGLRGLINSMMGHLNHALKIKCFKDLIKSKKGFGMDADTDSDAGPIKKPTFGKVKITNITGKNVDLRKNYGIPSEAIIHDAGVDFVPPGRSISVEADVAEQLKKLKLFEEYKDFDDIYKLNEDRISADAVQIDPTDFEGMDPEELEQYDDPYFELNDDSYLDDIDGMDDYDDDYLDDDDNIDDYNDSDGNIYDDDDNDWEDDDLLDDYDESDLADFDSDFDDDDDIDSDTEEYFNEIFLQEGGPRKNIDYEGISHQFCLIKDPAARQTACDKLFNMIADKNTAAAEKEAKKAQRAANRAQAAVATLQTSLQESYISEDEMLDAIDSAYGKFDSVEELVTEAGGNRPGEDLWTTGVRDIEKLYKKVKDVVKKEATWNPVAYKSWAGCEYLRDTWNLEWDKEAKNLINIKESKIPASMRRPRLTRNESMNNRGAVELSEGVYAYLRRAKDAASDYNADWFDLIIQGPKEKRVIPEWASRSKLGGGYRGGGIGPMAGPAYKVYELRSETGFSSDCEKTGTPRLRYMRHIESHIMEHFHNEFLDVYGGP